MKKIVNLISLMLIIAMLVASMSACFGGNDNNPQEENQGDNSEGNENNGNNDIEAPDTTDKEENKAF